MVDSEPAERAEHTSTEVRRKCLCTKTERLHRNCYALQTFPNSVQDWCTRFHCHYSAQLKPGTHTLDHNSLWTQVCGCDVAACTVWCMFSYHHCKSAVVGSVPRWALAVVIMVRYSTNILHAIYELFIIGALNIIERDDLVFQNLSEIIRVLPSLNTEECNTWTSRMLWVLFFFCRVRLLLVSFGMQLNINCRKSLRNFANYVVYNLSFCVLVIYSAVYFESVMVRLIVIETEEWRY